MSDVEREPRGPRPSPRWNVISACAPLVGFVAGLIAAMAAPHFRWFEWGFRAWLPFCVFGLIAAAIAVARSERWWGMTAAGLLANAALLFFLVPEARLDELLTLSKWWDTGGHPYSMGLGLLVSGPGRSVRQHLPTSMNRPILTLWLPWVLANAVAAGASVAVIWGAIHAGSSGGLPEGVFAAVWVSGLLFAAVGAAVGMAQWVVLRGLLAGAGRWIAVSALDLVAGTAAVGLSLHLLSGAAPPWSAVGWLVTGAAGGTVVGAGQWVVLRRQVEGAGWWLLASAAGASAGACHTTC